MAKLDVQGFNAFEADLEAAKNLTKTEKRKILRAGAETLRDWMRRVIEGHRWVVSGVLRDSIKITMRQKDGEPVAEIGPQGKHHVAHGWGPRKGRSMGRGKGAAYDVDAARVGFVLEFGAPYRNINAWHWMESAEQRATSSGELHAAMQNAFNEVLDAKGVGQ